MRYRLISWSFVAVTYLVAYATGLSWAMAFLWCIAAAGACAIGWVAWMVVAVALGWDVRLAERARARGASRRQR